MSGERNECPNSLAHWAAVSLNMSNSLNIVFAFFISMALSAEDAPGLNDALKSLRKRGISIELARSELISKYVDLGNRAAEEANAPIVQAVVASLADLDVGQACLLAISAAAKNKVDTKIEDVFNSVSAKRKSETFLFMMGMLRAGYQTNNLEQVKKILEANRGSLPVDLFVFFHSGILAVLGDIDEAKTEYKTFEGNPEWLSDIRREHPLAGGNFFKQ